MTPSRRSIKAAAKAVVPGGQLVVEETRVGEGPRIRAWFAAAGLVAIEEAHEPARGAIVVTGRKPAEDVVARRLDSELSRVGKIAWRELEASGRLRAGARPRRLEYPAPLRRMLSRALAERADDALERRYIEELPRLRVAQIVGTDEPAATLMHAPLDWSQLPRLSHALDRVFALLGHAGVGPALPLGDESAAAFRARTPTLGELHMRTQRGACMPLIADLSGVTSRGPDLHAAIDRDLTAAIARELCRFGRHREALSLHLDDCIAAYLAVQVWPELAYPAREHADAPWLAQVGQAFARAFGIAAVVRGQSGHATWHSALPRELVTAAERVAWDDWRARRSLDLVSETFAPRPWIALALVAGAGQSLRDHTLASLAQVPLAALVLRDDDAFDRVIVEDALRAMCAVAPPMTIALDARACSVTLAQPTAAAQPAPWYWLPPAVAARLVAHGTAGYRLHLADLRAISDVAATICGATGDCERDGFALVKQSV